MFEMNFIGNLVADPTVSEVVVKSTGEHLKVCHFRVAVNRGRDSQGNQQTEFVNCSAWRGLADICRQYLAKGRKVWVRGIPRATTATGSNGIQYANLECSIQNIEFLSPRQAAGETPAAAQTAPAQQTSAAPAAPKAPTAPAAPVVNAQPQMDEYIMIDEGELPF